MALRDVSSDDKEACEILDCFTRALALGGLYNSRVLRDVASHIDSPRFYGGKDIWEKCAIEAFANFLKNEAKENDKRNTKT